MHVYVCMYIYILGLGCSVEDVVSTLTGRSCSVVVAGVVDDLKSIERGRHSSSCKPHVDGNRAQRRSTVRPKSVRNRSKLALRLSQHRSQGHLRLPERSRERFFQSRSGPSRDPPGSAPGRQNRPIFFVFASLRTLIFVCPATLS